MLVFNYDTPPMLKQRNEFTKLRSVMSKIYPATIVQFKIDEISGGGMENANDSMIDIGYAKVFCDPHYSKSSLLGCALAVFQ